MLELYTSRIYRWSVVVLLAIFIAADTAFAVLQGDIPLNISMVYGAVYCVLLFLLGQVMWMPFQFSGRAIVTVIYLASALVVLAIVAFAAAKLAGDYHRAAYSFYTSVLPVRLVISLLCFAITIQYYGFKSREERAESEQPSDETEIDAANTETIDHIAVKKGSNLHIVAVEELIYIRADGDYVTLVTATGNYLKDETMKFLERSLPAARFVRIHRSYIVNLESIARIELTEKDSYSVILKNGTTLRASTNGYKLLKSRLSL